MLSSGLEYPTTVFSLSSSMLVEASTPVEASILAPCSALQRLGESPSRPPGSFPGRGHCPCHFGSTGSAFWVLR